MNKLILNEIENLDWSKGLIPTIIQDESGQVLSLVYSSKESLKLMFKTKKGTYYSRSRKEVWIKGKKSGNRQDVLKINFDCDKDTIIVKVKQRGVACHTGKYSCFDKEEFNLYKLFEVIKNRKNNPKEESYTSKLFLDEEKSSENKILEKIGEESTELIIASKNNNKEEILYEMGDLFYFCLTLLVKKEISYKKLIQTLEKRRK